MKRYFCFFLAVLITAMSIILYYPFNIYANDAFTISKNSTEKTGLTADEAQKAIDANADIKGKDGVTMLLYTPSDSYNYTLKSGAFVAHLSDSQAKAMLMSKKSFQQYVVLCSSLISNGTVFRGFLKTVGIATTGDSDALTNIVDKFTCNYNYLDSINYDEDTQTITMDNTSVDKLREEIKNYYYKSNGMFFIEPNTSKLGDILSSSWYSDMNLYTEDFNIANNYDYILYNTRYHFLAAFNKTDFSYGYSSGYERFQDSRCYYYDFQFVDKDLNNINLPFYYNFNIFETFSEDNSISLTSDSVGIFTLGSSNRYYSGLTSYFNNTKPCVPKERIGFYGYKFCDDIDFFSLSRYRYGESSSTFLYSKDGSSLLGFSSYDKIFDYVHGDSSAYLGSAINKVGEDISFSIKDMNENLGEKMDTLIDSINDKKGSMSADELQNAIDKGLEDLNKTSEDIKDNTNDILEVLKEQNQILLDILGVTKHIADTVDDIDDNANFSSLMSLLSTVFLGIQNAILYGQNTMDSDDNTDTQAITYDESGIAVYSSGGGTSLDYRGGIFGHFPFSVIYHLYDWLKVLQTEPKCPEFSYNYGFMIGRKDDTECQITFDLSQYESWRDVISSFMKLSFTLAVAVGTYKKFKGGDLS